MPELRWYLEEYLEYPFPPNTERAREALATLDNWGLRCWKALGGPERLAALNQEAAGREGGSMLRVRVASSDPEVLGWPWEALGGGERGPLGLQGCLERAVIAPGPAWPLPETLPRDRLNLLLVTARPGESDIGYRSISRPLLALARRGGLPMSLEVLRPPTFEELSARLEARPGHYHLIHFDGYGDYEGAAGRLLFERGSGGSRQVSPAELGALLKQAGVPLLALHACGSGVSGTLPHDPFCAVAAELLRAGLPGVLVVGYSLYVSGARVFLPEFFRALAASGDLSQAALEGRRAMRRQGERLCARGRCELRDCLAPVSWLREGFRLPPVLGGPDQAAAAAPPLKGIPGGEPGAIGFIGRDHELFRLERALVSGRPGVLVHGIGGIGKTTLVRGFLKWLGNTDGMDSCLWLDFTDLRSAEFMLDCLGEALFGQRMPYFFLIDKVDALVRELASRRVILVWDSFEAAAGLSAEGRRANLPEEDRDLLLTLLDKIGAGPSRVILVSRGPEHWLGERVARVEVGGLVSEERWEYCQAVLERLGLESERQDGPLVELMSLLEGHPLATRMILSGLGRGGVPQAVQSLRQRLDRPDPEIPGPEYESLYACLGHVVEQLAPEARELLIPLALHEESVDANFLDNMALQAPGRAVAARGHRCLLPRAGRGRAADRDHRRGLRAAPGADRFPAPGAAAPPARRGARPLEPGFRGSDAQVRRDPDPPSAGKAALRLPVPRAELPVRRSRGRAPGPG